MTFPAECFKPVNRVLTAKYSELEMIIEMNDRGGPTKPLVLGPLDKETKRHGFRIAGSKFPVVFEVSEIAYEGDDLVAWTLVPTAEEISKRSAVRNMSCIIFNE